MKILFYNGIIHTMDADKTAQAIGAVDGIITFVGADADALSLEWDEKVDLNGKCVLPGFIDSHMHLLGYAITESALKLNNAKSIDEAVGMAREYLTAGNLHGGWLAARGWNNEKFALPRFFNKTDLDRVSAEIPVIFTRVCGHIAVVNSKALEIIQNLPQAIEYRGLIDKDTGVLREGAAGLYRRAVKPFSCAEIEELIIFAAKKLNEAGITSVHTDDFTSLPVESRSVISDAYFNLAERRNESGLSTFTVRVTEQTSFDSTENIEEYIKAKEYLAKSNEFYRLGPVKIFQDGSLGGKTACLKEHYIGDENNCGIAIYTQAELDRIIKICHDNGLQTATHAIGDGAAEMVVNAIEKANNNNPKTGLRHGIVHAQVTDDALIARMRNENILVYAQPVFVASDMDMADSLLGPARAENAYRWKAMIDAGLHVSGGSDAPIESFNVLENIYCAVTREKLTGGLDGGWHPAERLSVRKAVRMFTLEGAYASFEERNKGTLEEGKLCDMVVLSDDIFECQPSEIKTIRVEKTVLGGITVYDAGN